LRDLHVAARPLLEDIDEEAAIRLAADGPLGHQAARLRAEQALATWLLAPALVGDGDRLVGCTLDDRDDPLGSASRWKAGGPVACVASVTEAPPCHGWPD